MLADLDDLDKELFGGRTDGKKATIDSLFGDSAPKTPAKRTNVTFGDTSSKSNLDDLFAEPSSKSIAPPKPATNPRPSRHQASTLSSILGPSKNDPDPVVETSVPIPQQPIHPSQVNIPPSQQDIVRVQRLENEIDRLNREIDDLKRRKKQDEEELEQSWKDKLAKKERERQDELEDLKTTHLKQQTKLQDEHAEELERMRSTYERQLDGMQATAGNARDLSSVVDRVDSISSTLNRLANDVTVSSERTFSEREMTLKLKEQAVETREQRLEEERSLFQEEKQKVFGLNVKLSEMCKDQETTMEQDKWKVRDEWNRLNAEKQIFKEDQKYVMEVIDKQKQSLEKTKVSFFREQHDLLMRVSSERSDLDQEKNQFYAKRTLDIRRLKEEANELQERIEAVEAAEKQTTDLCRLYQSKLNHLQELEVSLMEECVEMERIRNEMATMGGKSSGRERRPSQRPSNPKQLLTSRQNSTEEAEMPKRNDSVRTVLKKHSEFLEKYIGQKVAAVAPQTSFSDSL